MSTNTLVDVVRLFAERVLEDSHAQAREVHPIFQVDAIRFFRVQVGTAIFPLSPSFVRFDELTLWIIVSRKETSIMLVPLLIRYVDSDDYVCHTRNDLTVNWILRIRRWTHSL
jgi:hypothetical protein